MTQQQPDLSRLALDRSPARLGTPPRRRRWVSRYVLPLGILLGFVALLGAAAGRQLFSQKFVTVVPVIMKRGEVQQVGTSLFQAAGWIEPRPTAVRVAALAPGVIEELLVVEGQLVTKGEPIARLISIDAELAVEQGESTLAIRQGELQRAEAEQKAARIRLENPVHLEAQKADAESLLAKATTELEKLPFLITAAKAEVAFTQRSRDGKRSAGDAVAGVIVDRAIKDHESAVAKLGELQKRGPNLQREVKALQAKVDAVCRQLALLVEERRQLDEATAKVASATALRDEAKLNLRRAKLNLDRTVIRAPMEGRVLQLVASPGTRVMGLQQNAGQSSSTVVEMYDPNRLQVRADVRLEDVPMVIPGAPVEIQTASSGNVILGRVLQPTSSANIQKNTLEVKVELLQPPAMIRPEMLVTATFLAPELEPTSKETTETERLFVPELLVQSVDGTSGVWVVDANDQAVLQVITTGGQAAGGLVEVTSGLNATNKLIVSGREGLESGDPVVVSGEDQSIGVGN